MMGSIYSVLDKKLVDDAAEQTTSRREAFPFGVYAQRVGSRKMVLVKIFMVQDPRERRINVARRHESSLKPFKRQMFTFTEST